VSLGSACTSPCQSHLAGGMPSFTPLPDDSISHIAQSASAPPPIPLSLDKARHSVLGSQLHLQLVSRAPWGVLSDMEVCHSAGSAAEGDASLGWNGLRQSQQSPVPKEKCC